MSVSGPNDDGQDVPLLGYSKRVAKRVYSYCRRGQMAASGEAHKLVNRALGALASATRLVPVLEQCIRIAELRQDYYNLWWLRYEAVGYKNQRAWKLTNQVMRTRIASEHYETLRIQFAEDYMERHGQLHIPEGGGDLTEVVNTWSIGELDELIDGHEVDLSPGGVMSSAPAQFRVDSTLALTEMRKVRARVRERLHRFLVETEASIVFGQTAANAFERTRQYVDGQLGAIAPEVLAEFQAAYERAGSSSVPALAQALLSCRRVITAVADVLRPATGETVTGADGRQREMTGEKYRIRLWQYVTERVESDTTRDLILDTVQELGRRLDDLDALANKGLHANVTLAEADQCILQTYLLVGDLLRLRTPPASALA